GGDGVADHFHAAVVGAGPDPRTGHAVEVGVLGVVLREHAVMVGVHRTGVDPDVAAVGQGQDAVGTGAGDGHRATVDGDVGSAAGDADAVGIAAGGGDAAAAHGDVAVIVDAFHRDSVGEVA